MGRLADAVYILPLRRAEPAVDELSDYLGWLATLIDVVVVDGSPAAVHEAHRAGWQRPGLRVIDAPITPAGHNGKATGVNRALAVTTQNRIVVADDDIRYTEATLRRTLNALDGAGAVVPQNYFDPAPWHARWDTGRSLLNRALGHDYPGTLAVARRHLPPGGYPADVLFENLQLLRTIAGRGGAIVDAPHVYVRRLPPSTRHFFGQRVRQAYDSQAQPVRLVAELAIVPVLVASRRHPAQILAMATLACLLAERGRRRRGGTQYFPVTAALLAPGWLVERGVCSWIALTWRLKGGAPYAGSRIRHAAHPARR